MTAFQDVQRKIRAGVDLTETLVEQLVDLQTAAATAWQKQVVASVDGTFAAWRVLADHQAKVARTVSQQVTSALADRSEAPPAPQG